MTKRILSVLLALVLVLGLSTVALAEATIKINKAVDGQTYTAYKMFDITSAGTGDNAPVAYTVADGWNEFFTTGKGADYVTVDEAGNVTKKENANFDNLAQDALAYATSKGLTGSSADADASGVVTITVPTAGYYVVDSSVGALVMMDTNKGEMIIEEKNAPSDSDKVITNSNNTDTNNNVNIGDTVNYKVTISAKKGAATLKLVDTMDAGLTFGNAVTVTKDGTALNAGTDYELKTTGIDGTFEVVFTGILPLTADSTIVVEYSAVVNENAKIDQPNKNTASLKYGDNYEIESAPDTTETYSFDIDVFKYTGNADNKTGLADAEFQLKCGDKVLTFSATGSTYLYDAESTNTTLKSGSDGYFYVDGLKAGTYTLTETKAPAGYNMLTKPITIVIANDGTFTVDGTTATTAEVKNSAGTTLPSTGGIGTTMFYVIGGLLMAFAVVLLVAKKRTVNE